MADNKQNNIKLYASIKKFFEDTKAKFDSYYTKTQADGRVEYRKGTGETFYETSEVKPDINPKFEDTSLFQKITVKDGFAIVGGSTGQEIKGSIPATSATQAEHSHGILFGASAGALGNDDSKWYNPDGQIGGNIKGYYYSNPINTIYGTSRKDGNTFISKVTPKITIHQTVAHNTTGTVDAKGYSMIKYIFIAKKDITHAEMNNLGSIANGI